MGKAFPSQKKVIVENLSLEGTLMLIQFLFSLLPFLFYFSSNKILLRTSSMLRTALGIMVYILGIMLGDTMVIQNRPTTCQHGIYILIICISKHANKYWNKIINTTGSGTINSPFYYKIISM